MKFVQGKNKSMHINNEYIRQTNFGGLFFNYRTQLQKWAQINIVLRFDVRMLM